MTERRTASLPGCSRASLIVTLVIAACGSPQASPTALVVTASPTPAATGVETTSSPEAPASDHPTPVALTPSPKPQPASWATTGSMREALSGVQAARLGDGRVLAVGRRSIPNDDIGATVAELWDPTTGHWSETEGLDNVRTEFALVSLADGRALVAGGRNTRDESFSSAWAFDPATEHWSKVGLMDKARAAPAAAVLPDGRVLVAGGYFAFEPRGDRPPGVSIDLAAYRPPRSEDDPSPVPLDDVDIPPGGRAMATAELFDPRTGTWSPTGSMRYARAGAVAVTLSDGRVLVVGSTTEPGQGPVIVDGGALSTAEIFDPATGRFSPAGGLSGFDVDPPAWARDVPLGGDVGRVGTLVALDDGGALLVGHTEWQKHSADFSTSYRFDPTRKTWSEIQQAFVRIFDNGPRERSWSSAGRDLAGTVAIKLDDGRVLIAGGGGMQMESRSPIVRAARLYVPATSTWSKVPKMPAARTGATGVLLEDGSVLVIGGYADQDHGYQDSTSANRFMPSR